MINNKLDISTHYSPTGLCYMYLFHEGRMKMSSGSTSDVPDVPFGTCESWLFPEHMILTQLKFNY